MSDSEPANDTAADSSAWDDTRITAYVMGELSPEDKAAFEDAVATDPELRAAVDQAGTLTDELHKLFATETPNSAPPVAGEGAMSFASSTHALPSK